MSSRYHSDPSQAGQGNPFTRGFALALLLGVTLNPLNTSMVATALVSIDEYFSVGAGGSALMSVAIAVVGVTLSGVAMGLANVGNQAMLYIASPPKDMGVNSGFYRTASYLGGFVATGVIATLFSGGASNASMLVSAGVFAVLAVVLVGLTVADRETPARS